MKPVSVIAAAAVVLAAAFAPAQAQTVLTASSWAPPGQTLTAKILVPWTKEVEKATQGRVKFNLLPKPPVAPAQTFDGVRDGMVDVSFAVHGYNPGRFLLTKATEFAFLGDSAETVSVAYQRLYERRMAQHNEHAGVKVIGVYSHGPGQIYTVKKPVAALADMANLKMRVGGGVVNDYAKAMGAVPLLKPSSEAFQLLQSGVADGIFFPSESILGFKLTGVIRHVTLIPGGIYNASLVMLMNQGRFDALPKADQDAINRVSGEFFARLAGKAWDSSDAEGLEAMKTAGIQVVRASPAFVAELKKAIDPVEQAWYAELKAKGVDGAALMAEFRAEIKRVAAGN